MLGICLGQQAIGEVFGCSLTNLETVFHGVATKVKLTTSNEVLFNNIGAIVVSWTDTEIKARVPHRHLFGNGKPGQFSADLSTGTQVIRRGSWDMLPDGTCCTSKKWLTLEAGTFTIEAKGMPDQSFFESRPEGATND